MNIKNLRKNKKGFTLIEIIVVVVILAVLMAVAVPSVMKYMNEADDARYLAQARGGMIVAQKEAADAWIAAPDSSKPTTHPVSVDGVAAIGGTPKVKGISSTIDASGNITLVTVTFDDKTAEITPNGKVELKEKNKN